MSAILDDLRAMTDHAKNEHERRRQDIARAEKAEQEQNKQKAIAAAIDFYKDKLPDELKQEAHKGNHELRLHYIHNNYMEETRIHHIAALCRADGLMTKFDSYTSDYGDSAAPCISTSYYLIISWK